MVQTVIMCVSVKILGFVTQNQDIVLVNQDGLVQNVNLPQNLQVSGVETSHGLTIIANNLSMTEISNINSHCYLPPSM